MKNLKPGKKTAWGLVAMTCALLIGANAHFIYLATSTQPDCVAHKKTGMTPEKGFSAAKSSC